MLLKENIAPSYQADLNIEPSYRADLEKHSDAKCFQCALCNRVFTCNSDLKKHKFFHADSEKLIFYQVSPSKVLLGDLVVKGQEVTEPIRQNEPTLPSDPFASQFTEKSVEKPRYEVMDRDDTAETHVDDIENIKITSSERNNLEIHNHAQQFACSLCNKSFTEKGALKRHMPNHTDYLEIQVQTDHSDAKHFPCSLCIKSFTQGSSLTKHMLIHHSLFDIQMVDQVKPCRVLLRDFLHDSLLNIQGGVRIEQTAVPQASVSSEAETRGTAVKPYSCSLSTTSFAQNNSLKSHMRTHTKEKPFTCKVCCKSFSLKKNLYRHMRIHTGEKPYPCIFCSKRFSQSSDLKKHIHIHTREMPFRCSHCSTAFVDRMALTKHMKFHTEQRAQEEAKTDIIEESLVQPGITKVEQDSVSQTEQCPVLSCEGSVVKENNKIEKQYACSLCTKLFSYISSLKSHMRTHAKEERNTCTFCGKLFSHKGNLNVHMRIHTGEKPFSCTFCNKLFSQKGDMKSHIRSHTGEKPFSCSFCGKSFAQRLSLRRHIVRHTGTFSSNVTAQGLATTDIIDDSAAGPETVTLHHKEDIESFRDMARRVCPETVTPHLKEDIESVREVARRVCPETVAPHTKNEKDRDLKLNIPGWRALDIIPGGRALDTIPGMAENIRISEAEPKVEDDEESGPIIDKSDTFLCRTMEKPYSCSLCKKSFAIHSTLKVHMRIHTNEKPFTCTLCSKPFSVKSNLTRHMRCHTGEKPYSCVMCYKLFSQTSDMKAHMRTHTGEKRCSSSHCNKSYATKRFFKKHVRKQTTAISYSDSPDNVVKVNVKMSEAESNNCKFETTEKLNTCSLCNKSFTRNHSLKVHMRIHTGEKLFSCNVCCKPFSQIGHLNTHMHIHTGEKPFLCVICNKLFSQQSNLQYHMRTHHAGEKQEATEDEPYSV